MFNQSLETSSPASTPSDADRAAQLTHLYEVAKPRMMAVARRVVRNETDAEDVVQQAFISAFRNLDSYEGRAQMTTWLHRITHNAALMHLRTKRRKGAVSLDALPENVGDAGTRRLHENWAVEVPEVEEIFGSEALRASMDAAINDLKVLDQRIVRRLLEQEWSVSDVAEAEGMTAGAIKSRLHRARGALCKVLEGDQSVQEQLFH